MISEVIKETIKLKEKYTSYRELVDDMDITLFPGDFENVYGYTDFLQNNKSIIVYNCNLNEFEQTFIILHEIGHLLFHDKVSRKFHKSINSDKEEIEADLFAVFFGNFHYSDSTNWINKKINYIYCNYLNCVNLATILK